MENIKQNQLRELVKPYFTSQKQAASEIGMCHVTFNHFLKGKSIPKKHLPNISAWLNSMEEKKPSQRTASSIS